MHVFIALVVGAVLGLVAGYAFRGKENKALHAVGDAVANKVESEIKK